MDEFALVLFDDEQEYHVLRFELLESISEANSIAIGESVYARFSHNSSKERAKLISRGSMEECEAEQAVFVKAQIQAIQKASSSKKKVDSLTKNDLSEENCELLKKCRKLNDDFDQLYMKYNDLKKVNIEKDALIASLQVQNDKLQEYKDSTTLRSFETEAELPACNSCQKVGSDVIELIKSNSLLKDKINLLIEHFENSQNKADQFETNGQVKLGPNIFVNRTRFIYADSSKTPTAFTQRIVTAVFSYEEIIGATMTGRSTKSKKRQSSKKGLPEEKLTGLIAFINGRFKGDPSLMNVKKEISWKVSSLNNGTATQNDLLHWEGYDPESFKSLSPKRSNIDLETSTISNSTNSNVSISSD